MNKAATPDGANLSELVSTGMHQWVEDFAREHQSRIQQAKAGLAEMAEGVSREHQRIRQAVVEVSEHFRREHEPRIRQTITDVAEPLRPAMEKLVGLLAMAAPVEFAEEGTAAEAGNAAD
ncbi:hypothetical protein F0U60_37525 [Archangium minus]|uniref:Phasin family protein n=1 Tax=Archangium minus TaxID=83450 RepID=A0ABY9X1B2_9BACT|nr:hypothetical protein F0U60_37525 [Archangium minus]